MQKATRRNGDLVFVHVMTIYPAENRISTGSPPLDEILSGGLIANRLYLLEGAPGSGKTSLALKFLLDGVARNEGVLYITLSETAEELAAVAASHGWSLAGISLFELSHSELALSIDDEQTLLHPWEVELGETVRLITTKVEEIKPLRVVFDSLSEMRLLAQEPLRFRRQILALKQYFAGRDITVLLVDDLTARTDQDIDLHSLTHGVITLERHTLDFGIARRRLQVQKLRGSAFREGFHDFSIKRGGVEIYPRLVAAEHHTDFNVESVPSGSAELDALLGGGPLRGTSTLITGPAGSGKTTLALQFVVAACQRGERCVIYEFDERIGTMLVRARSVGLDLQPYIDQKLLYVRQIDPSEISPGYFSCMVKEEVEQENVRLIVIDSLSGYVAAMPQEKELILQLHEVLSYLNQQGATTLLINPQHGLVGSMNTGNLNISYVADAVILLRFFEAEGRIRKALSVLKNRASAHESTIRELMIDSQGLRVGEPLSRFSGILTGTPSYVGANGPLMEPRARDV